jgi:hypothetical protein
MAQLIDVIISTIMKKRTISSSSYLHENHHRTTIRSLDDADTYLVLPSTHINNQVEKKQGKLLQ